MNPIEPNSADLLALIEANKPADIQVKSPETAVLNAGADTPKKEFSSLLNKNPVINSQEDVKNNPINLAALPVNPINLAHSAVSDTTNKTVGPVLDKALTAVGQVLKEASSIVDGVTKSVVPVVSGVAKTVADAVDIKGIVESVDKAAKTITLKGHGQSIIVKLTGEAEGLFKGNLKALNALTNGNPILVTALRQVDGLVASAIQMPVQMASNALQNIANGVQALSAQGRVTAVDLVNNTLNLVNDTGKNVVVQLPNLNQANIPDQLANLSNLALNNGVISVTGQQAANNGPLIATSINAAPPVVTPNSNTSSPTIPAAAPTLATESVASRPLAVSGSGVAAITGLVTGINNEANTISVRNLNSQEFLIQMSDNTRVRAQGQPPDVVPNFSIGDSILITGNRHSDGRIEAKKAYLLLIPLVAFQKDTPDQNLTVINRPPEIAFAALNTTSNQGVPLLKFKGILMAVDNDANTFNIHVFKGQKEINGRAINVQVASQTQIQIHGKTETLNNLPVGEALAVTGQKLEDGTILAKKVQIH